MTSCVYALKNLSTKKFYIGSTVNCDARRSSWKRSIRYKQIPFAFNSLSCNPDDWEFVVLQEVPREALASTELLYLTAALQSTPDRVLNKATSTGRVVPR